MTPLSESQTLLKNQQGRFFVCQHLHGPQGHKYQNDA